MARGGINKALVQKARDALQARGIRASIDAVRVELGNTGSKSTILRYLQELSAVQAPSGPVALEDELGRLISSVAERLQEAAKQAVANDQTRVDQAWQRHAQAQEQQRELVESLRDQVRRLDAQVEEHRQRELAAQSYARDLQTQLEAQQRQLTQVQHTLDEREAHLTALSERHDHLKASRDHFQEQQRTQREQELARHDQQVQQLSKELRTLQASLLAKQEELATLNRANERLLTESRLASRQALTDSRDYSQARAEWQQLAQRHQQAQAQWQTEEAELRERLRAALLKQRSDALYRRHEQRQILQLQRLLDTSTHRA